MAALVISGPSLHLFSEVPYTAASTGLLIEPSARAVCSVWEAGPPYFPMACSPLFSACCPITSTALLLPLCPVPWSLPGTTSYIGYSSLCLSSAPQTRLPWSLSHCNAWPRKATPYVLSNYSSIHFARSPLTPSKYGSYLLKTYEIRITCF